MLKWIREHKKILILIVILAVVALIVGILAARGDGSTQEETRETATVEKRTLVETVSATGTFVASDEAQVSSDTTGVEVISVNVEVGDTVAQGDVIAILDTTDLQEDLADAQESLNTTNEQTQRTRDSAQRNLEQAGKDRDENLADVDTDIQDAYDDWQAAESTYQDSLDTYNKAQATLDGITDTAGQAYVSASNQVSSAKRQVESDRRSADSAKDYYDRLVSQREDRIQQINDNYQDQVDTYNDTMENTEDAGETQRERIEDLQEQIAGAVVTAPAAGLVTAVNIEVGDTYNGSTIAVINNVDTFDVTTEIDEYDINDIAEGQEVVIKTNATGDQELSGVVTKVSPIATGSGSSGSLGGSLGGMDISSILGGSSSSLTGSSSDDVTFTVTIHVNTISDKLRIGMTAKLSIIKQKNEDVLSVPYNAVQSDDDETFYVEKITGTSEEDGSCITQRITVVKGIESDYYTEIIGSDLSQGDQVLLPKTEGGNSLQDLINESGSMGGV